MKIFNLTRSLTGGMLPTEHAVTGLPTVIARKVVLNTSMRVIERAGENLNSRLWAWGSHK